MSLLRIRDVQPLGGWRLSLTLTDGSIIERDVSALLRGPVLEPLRRDPELFRKARVEGGAVIWPGGADICPDVLIWGGAPPESAAAPPARLSIKANTPTSR